MTRSESGGPNCARVGEHHAAPAPEPHERDPGLQQREGVHRRAARVTPRRAVTCPVAVVHREANSFTPGTKYAYSNSDNVIVGLMIEAATGSSYERALHSQVAAPFGLSHTTLPSDAKLPRPFVRGCQRDATGVPEDVSGLFAAGWAWASGGVVSTPEEANEFVRRYVAGREIDSKTHTEQFQFIPGGQLGPARPR